MTESKTTTALDVNEIMKRIPHRYPFLMIDKVIDIVKGESCTGVKNVSVNEPFFQGHFPGHPIMPGVLIVEAMAQSAATLVVDSMEGVDSDSHVVYFMSVEEARFRKPVLPGVSFLSRSRRNAIAALSGNSRAKPMSMTALWPRRSLRRCLSPIPTVRCKNGNGNSRNCHYRSQSKAGR